MRAEEDPRFRVLRPLGSGGTAEVKLVRLVDRGIDAALKVPFAPAAEPTLDFNRLADREFHLIGRHRFPGLVRLLEPPHRGPDYLLLEYCAGPTLDRLGRVENLSQATALLAAIAATLEFLHAHRLIHGDLKPHNLFLPTCWQEAVGRGLFRVKLSDFSLGRTEDEDESLRAGVGTIGYMAPETIAEKRTSHRSDLFALGVIGYQMLSGRHPFLCDEADPLRVNSRVLEETPAPLSGLRPDLDERVVRLIERLMSKHETDRPSRALEVCLELERLGCDYPYRNVLHPSWLLPHREPVHKTLERWIDGDARTRSRLEVISGDRPERLRLCLSSNFRRGNLAYCDGRFAFLHKPIWPSRLRRQALRTFAEQPLSARRASVTAAVVGHAEAAAAVCPRQRDLICQVVKGTIALLRPLLRPVTIRRLSARLASPAELSGDLATAAQLFMQAGDLVNAERCAYEAAYAYRRSHENAKALALLRRVIRYAELTGRLWEIRQLLMLAGDLHKENGDAEQALVCYRRIIFLYEHRAGDKLLAETYKDLGDLYKMKQDFPAGLEALRRALAIYQELNDELEISHTHNNMGNIYWIAGDMAAALKRYRQALRIQRRLGASGDIASTLSNMGAIFVLRGRYRGGLRLLERSLALKREIGHLGEIARTLNNLGYTLFVSGDSPGAVGAMRESLDLNRRIGSKKEILFNLDNLAAIMVSAGMLTESIAMITEGLELAERLEDRHHRGVFYLALSQTNVRLGRFDLAQEYQDKAGALIAESDDPVLDITLDVQKADRLYRLGQFGEALTTALTTLRKADERRIAAGQIGALLLVTRLCGDESYREAAARLVHDSHLVREGRLLAFSILEYALRTTQGPVATELLERCQQCVDAVGEDLELPWMQNLIVEARMRSGGAAATRAALLSARRFAEKENLKPDLMVSLLLLGRQDAEAGRYEACFAAYQQALAIAKQIAGSIADPADRGSYQQRQEIQYLVGEIRNLGGRFGEKKRAGFGPALSKT